MTSQPKNSTNGQSAELPPPEPESQILDSQFQISDSESRIQNDQILSSAELAEIWARRAHALAEEPRDEAKGQTVALLVFWLGNERYGLEVTSVCEIHPLQQMTSVPRTPNFVAGVFSARGRILSVIDLRAFFGLSAIDLSDQTKIIVVANNDPTSETAHMEVGILADAVDDVITVLIEDIEPPLTTHRGVQAECLQGITADMLTVLDLNALLNDRHLVVYEEVM